MSKRGIRIALGLFASTILISCLNEVETKHAPKPVIQFRNYQKIYNQLFDSINNFVGNRLYSFRAEYTYKWMLDSNLYFTRDSSRFVSYILISSGFSQTPVTDIISVMLGEKINEHWYFFKEGVTIAVPRELYAKNTREPLSFAILDEVALKELTGGYCKKDRSGSLTVNEGWVNSHFEGNAWCQTCATRNEYEKVHLKKAVDNWERN